MKKTYVKWLSRFQHTRLYNYVTQYEDDYDKKDSMKIYLRQKLTFQDRTELKGGRICTQDH